MNVTKRRVEKRKQRAFSVRKNIKGTAECPRLSVRRSIKNISAQITDDISGKSIIQVSSTSKEIAADNKTDLSVKVGELLAEKAAEKGITEVVFDRKGYKFQGRVKALADAARNKGLKF